MSSTFLWLLDNVVTVFYYKYLCLFNKAWLQVKQNCLTEVSNNFKRDSFGLCKCVPKLCEPNILNSQLNVIRENPQVQMSMQGARIPCGYSAMIDNL